MTTDAYAQFIGYATGLIYLLMGTGGLMLLVIRIWERVAWKIAETYRGIKVLRDYFLWVRSREDKQVDEQFMNGGIE